MMSAVLWLVLVALVRPLLAFNHWIVTEEGKIEHQVASPFNLRRPFSLLAFLQQEERVNTLRELRDELIEYKNKFQDYTTYDSFDFGFRAHDLECQNVPPLSTHDLYISTVLPLEHKGISLSDHLNFSPYPNPGEPFCLTLPLEFSAYAMEHLEGVQKRKSLVAPPEKSVFASLDLKSVKVEVFGSVVHQALEENSTSWVLLNLATLYWRARGNPYHAIECIRKALHYSPLHSMDVALLNLANILHRSQQSQDATVALNVAISIAPDVNILYYTLGNIYAAMGELNKSVDNYLTSLAMDPQSGLDTVHSVYMSARCELKIEEALKEHSRKLEATQEKLDQFYKNLDLIQRNQLPETEHKDHIGHTGHSSKELLEDDLLLDRHKLKESLGGGQGLKKGKKGKKGRKPSKSGQATSEAGADAGGNQKSKTSALNETETTAPRDSQLVLEEALDRAVLLKNGSSSNNSQTLEGSKRLSGKNDTVVSKTSDERRRRSTLRLVLDTSCSCYEATSPLDTQTSCANPTTLYTKQDEFAITPNFIQQCPVDPVLGYSHLCGRHACSCYSNVTQKQVVGESQSDSRTSKETFGNLQLSDALDCAIGNRDSEECLRLRAKNQHSNTQVEQEADVSDEENDLFEEERRLRKILENREKRRKVQDAQKGSKNRHSPSPRKPGMVVAPIRKLPEPSPQSEPNVISPSASYRGMEFLPYNPLPAQLEEAMFPDRSSPLAQYDDPMWPTKGECLEMVATVKSSSPIARFTGTFLTPEARGANMEKLLAPVPLSLPSYMRQKPRCTDIVELPHSMASLDHLEPVMYRTTLRTSEQAGEKGLRKVLIGVVTGNLDVSFSFNESSERTYAAMLKNGPNWALFNIASLFWRVQGDAHNAIECLRRAIHFAPNSAKDVGYIGLANVLHRHGFLNEAVVSARAALDINGDSPVGHYTMAGIYLSLADYLAASLHLRAALHAQPVFEHALSALKLVRCSLKFTEEQEYLKRKMRQAQEELLSKQEAMMAKNLGKAIASGHNPQKVVQPAIVISQEQPPRFPEELAMGEPPIASSFTGDDAIRYLTKLSLSEQVKKREKEMEREKELRKDKRTTESQLQEISVQSVEDSDNEMGVKAASEGAANAEFAEPAVEPPSDSAEPEVEPHSDPADPEVEPHSDPADPEVEPHSDPAVPEVEPHSDPADPEMEPHSDSSDSGVSNETADDELHDLSVKESDSDTDGTEITESDSNANGAKSVSEIPSENYLSTDNHSSVAEPSNNSKLSHAVTDELQQEGTMIDQLPAVNDNESDSQFESEGDNQQDIIGSESDLSEDASQNLMEHNSQLEPNPMEWNGDSSEPESNPVEQNEDIAQSESTPTDLNEDSRQADSIPEENNHIETENENQAEDHETGKESGSNGTGIESKIPPVTTVSTQRDTTSKSKKGGASDESDPMSVVKVANDDLLSRDNLEDYISSVADLINRNMTPVQRRVPGKIKTREDIRNEEIKKRFPGHRPWPTLEECRNKGVPKTIPFTSTWLAVTAKKIDVRDHVDFDLPLERSLQLPHCHNDFEDSHRTLSHLPGMHATPLKEYRPEMGLTDVLCQLEGSHRSLNEMATRIKLAMDKNSTSWVLSNLAALYWRIMGEGQSAVQCLRHALYYSDNSTKDVALVSLANVLYRLGFDIDATAVLQMALEVGTEFYDRASPNLVVTHFTMANILAARGYLTEAGGFYESTLHFQPEFNPAAERLWNVRCLTLIGKAIREKKELGRLKY